MSLAIFDLFNELQNNIREMKISGIFIQFQVQWSRPAEGKAGLIMTKPTDINFEIGIIVFRYPSFVCITIATIVRELFQPFSRHTHTHTHTQAYGYRLSAKWK